MRCCIVYVCLVGVVWHAVRHAVSHGSGGSLLQTYVCPRSACHRQCTRTGSPLDVVRVVRTVLYTGVLPLHDTDFWVSLSLSLSRALSLSSLSLSFLSFSLAAALLLPVVVGVNLQHEPRAGGKGTPQAADRPVRQRRPPQALAPFTTPPRADTLLHPNKNTGKLFTFWAASKQVSLINFWTKFPTYIRTMRLN